MNYLSVPEVAQKWNISASRVARLAKAGRIDGAIFVSNRWMIPVTAQKPSDHRAKEVREAIKSSTQCSTRFRFPLYIYENYLDENYANSLTTEEKILFDAELSYVSGEHESAYAQLEKIIQTTDNIYIKIGAYYFYALCAIRLRKYAKFMDCVAQMEILFKRDFHHKKDMQFIMMDISTYCYGLGNLIKQFNIDPEYNYDKSEFSYIVALSCYAAVAKAYDLKENPSTDIYEICCSQADSVNYYICAQRLHALTALLFSYKNNEKKCEQHIRAAIDSSVKSGHFDVHSISYRALRFTYEKILADYDPSVSERIRALDKERLEDFSGLLKFKNEDNLYTMISSEDYYYINGVQQGVSNKEMAADTGLSETTISKKLASIYLKVGVQNKKELADLIINTHLSYSYKLPELEA